MKIKDDGFTDEQLSEEDVINLFELKPFESWSDDEIFLFQYTQERLWIDFARFHKAAEVVLKRPVFTHEFASLNRMDLLNEYLGLKGKLSIDDIVNLIPKDKLIIMGV